MKLIQLRYLSEIAKWNSVSKAAAVLCTSQSGVSKQIMLLEEELNINLFIRKGKNLSGLTPAGKKILMLAEQTLDKTRAIKQVAEQFNNEPGSLTIATTHTQARYVLPYIVDRFLKKYPDTVLHINQGTPEQVARMLETGEADLSIATESLTGNPALIALPCYQWNRSIIVNQGHPLTQLEEIKLTEIVKYPIITYVLGFTGRALVDQAFASAGLNPNIVLSAVDSDVIKTYVRLGLGIGIIANMAFNQKQDNDLTALNVDNLFGTSTSYIAVKKDAYLPQAIYRFIELIAPHLTEQVIRQVENFYDIDLKQGDVKNIQLPKL